MQTPAMPHAERHILSPSSLNRLVQNLLADSFPPVWIEGEVSNLARPASGHVYFTLKDDKSQIRCAMFRTAAMRSTHRAQVGDKVLLRARVSLYAVRGDYQLIVDHMEDAGFGALQRAFEELKARLDREGLFDPAHKQPLPVFPRRLGVITSATGAAIKDVLHVLERRFPLLQVDILPVPVQGAQAAPAIVRALQAADAMQQHDVLLVTRGGGSLEDLSAFNDEAVARAMYACRIPVVSAIGHEIDFTISDFVADMRAPTPSAAAEILVPDQAELHAQLQQLHQRLTRMQQYQLQARAQRLDDAWRRLNTHSPERAMSSARVFSLQLKARLERAITTRLAYYEQHTSALGKYVHAHHPQRVLQQQQRQLHVAQRRLQRLLQTRLDRERQSLAQLARALHAVSPLATLERGYAIALDDDGKLLRTSRDIKVEQHFQLRMIDATIRAKRITEGES